MLNIISVHFFLVLLQIESPLYYYIFIWTGTAYRYS